MSEVGSQDWMQEQRRCQEQHGYLSAHQKHRLLVLMLRDLAWDLSDGGLHVAYERDHDFQIAVDLWKDVKKVGREIATTPAEPMANPARTTTSPEEFEELFK